MHALLLTSCINPSTGHETVKRSDPEVRQRDYAEALHFWLSYNEPRISGLAFVDNSGWPLAELEQEVSRLNHRGMPIDFISFRGNDYPPGVHYGYAELGIIDHALRTSALLQSSDHFIKVTGRLVFPSLTRLLDRLPPDFKFAVDGRHPGWWAAPAHRIPSITTQLMLFETEFYTRHLLGARSRMLGNTTHIEDFLFRELATYQGSPGVFLRWPTNAHPRGFAAHWDKDYSSCSQRLKSMVRSVCRRLCPGWWV